MGRNEKHTLILNINSLKSITKLWISVNIIKYFIIRSSFLHINKKNVRQLISFKNVVTDINVDTNKLILFGSKLCENFIIMAYFYKS